MENKTLNHDPQQYVALADQTYLDYIKAGKYKEIISNMANLGNYTLRNQMLILHQMPSATQVGTMNSWNYNKRSIQPGSKSLKILAPVFDNVVTSGGGDISAKQAKIVTNYKINFVFDISQTQTKSAEATTGRVEDYDSHYDTISEALMATLKGYEFKTAKMENDGILNTMQKTVTFREGMTQEETIKTLVEQVAAALVVNRERSRSQGLNADHIPNIAALEISAASNIVAKRLGIEYENLQEPEFGNMTEYEIEKFASNIGVARSVSQVMIMAMDNAILEAESQSHVDSHSQVDSSTHDPLFGNELIPEVDNDFEEDIWLDEPVKPKAVSRRAAKQKEKEDLEMAS